jgi:hypothetical protein
VASPRLRAGLDAPGVRPDTGVMLFVYPGRSAAIPPEPTVMFEASPQFDGGLELPLSKVTFDLITAGLANVQPPPT